MAGNTTQPTSTASQPTARAADDNSQVSSNYSQKPVNKRKVLDQYLKEKLAAMRVRQVAINKWIRNEELYNGVTQKTLMTRSNLHVPKVFDAVHTMSSRIGKAPECDYDTMPEGDENASELMKHSFRDDAKSCGWNLSFENSKIECGIYGRGIFKMIPGNERNRWENIDTLSFLISPIAKNCQYALYEGQQFIYKTMSQIDEDANAKDSGYDMEEVKKLKENQVPAESQSDTSSEASTKNIRLANMGLANVTQYGSKVAEITEWYTYLDQDNVEQSERVPYVLTVANDAYLLRAIPLSEAGLPSFPFRSYGIFTRGITFWCLSVSDVSRDPNLALNLAVNQLMDNNTYRNFNMIFVSSSSGLKQSSLVPRPLGVTPVTVAPGQNIKDNVFPLEVADISGSAITMQIINSFCDSALGLGTGIAPGSKGKASVTQQAQQQAMNQMLLDTVLENVNDCCRELYQLYAECAQMNFTVPRSIKIFGEKQLTIENVTRKNYLTTQDADEKEVPLKFIAKATSADTGKENKAIKQKALTQLFELFKDDPLVKGQTAMRRYLAKQFDIPASVSETFFEEDPNAPAQPVPPTGNANGQPAPQPAPTPATALLGQTQGAAQAQVPPAIK